MKKYTIESGDSLSGIAKKFGFPRYEPIWIYNTRVNPALTSGDPNRIAAGVTITIPKTKQQYDEAISRLEELRMQLEEDFREMASELDTAKKDVDRFGERIDLTADLLMVGKAAVQAGIKIGSKRYRNYIIRKKGLMAAQKVLAAAIPDPNSNEGIIIDQANGAVVESSIMLQAKKGLQTARVKKVFAKGASQALAKKGAVLLARSAAPVEEANAAADLVGLVADFLIGGLEAIKPTSVAKIYVRATTGEHPDDTYDWAKKQIQAGRTKSLERLGLTAVKLREERGLLYGG